MSDQSVLMNPGLPDHLDEELKKDTYQEVLELLGLDTGYMARKLKEEMEATETKFFHHQGEVVESREVVAWPVRQRARMDLQNLMGVYPEKGMAGESVVILQPAEIKKPASSGVGERD